MGFDNENVNYSIVKGQAYTEDHVLVYNIFVVNIAKTTTEVQALNYFKQFGEVLKVRLMMGKKKRRKSSKIGFINFADSKVAAKVLQTKNHRLDSRHIILMASYSWHQPGGQTDKSFVLADSNRDTAIEQASCSNSKSLKFNALILNLNDDCLEQICKNLDMRDQINFAHTCRRFSDVFIMLSKIEYKMLVLDKLTLLTLWQIRKFLEMAGPQIECLVGEVPVKERKRIVEFLGSYCINSKRVNVYSTQLNSVFLRKLIGKMTICTELELNDVALEDNCIPHIKCMPELRILKLEENCALTGKHICELRDIEELSLNGSRNIQSYHFKEICKNLTNLHTLDIRNCVNIKLGDFKEITKHLIKLESLKFSSLLHEPYECIAQLPKLKHLEILDIDRLRPIRYQLFVELVKYQSEQLEELILISANSLNLEKATLIGNLKKLKRLSCGNNEALDDQCLDKFSQLVELEEINLKNCNTFTNKGLLNLLKHCHKLNRLNIIRCNSLTDTFIFDALKLLQQQDIQKQRKGPVLLLANRTKIDKFVADTPEFKALSHLMKITFEFPFFDYKFFDDFEEFFDFSDDSEFEDDEEINFVEAYINSDDDDFYMYYSDDDEENDLFPGGLEAFNLFNYNEYGEDNDILW